MSDRPSWDEYFLEVCHVVAKRATCDRGRTACVIVKDKQILATGYVGSPVGLPHCDEAGHQIKKTVHEDGSVSTHCVRTIHSEQNAICQAAKKGIALDGATLYAKMMPCFTCAKMIVNAGVKRVVVEKRYHADRDSENVLRLAGVDLTILSQENEEYPNQ
jgi:dCMP deaminase